MCAIYKYDAATDTNKEILNISKTNADGLVANTWYEFTDDTPDPAEWIIDVDAGDRMFCLLSQIGGIGAAKGMLNMSFEIHYDRGG